MSEENGKEKGDVWLIRDRNSASSAKKKVVKKEPKYKVVCKKNIVVIEFFHSFDRKPISPKSIKAAKAAVKNTFPHLVDKKIIVHAHVAGLGNRRTLRDHASKWVCANKKGSKPVPPGQTNGTGGRGSI